MNIIEDIRFWLFMRRLRRLMGDPTSEATKKRIYKACMRLERDELIRGENHEFMVE